MGLEWMGNYRDVVEAMIRMCNTYYGVYKAEFLPEIHLSPAQLQVLEYILENESRNDNMSAIARRLSIPQSSFSKIANELVRLNFLDKYHLANNGKDVIIKVSDYGKKCYAEYSSGRHTDVWRRIFKRLDGLDTASVQVFVACLNEFTDQMLTTRPARETEPERGPQLVRMK